MEEPKPDDLVRTNVIKAIDKAEWKPPVDAESFETYIFEAKPSGSLPHRFPNYYSKGLSLGGERNERRTREED